MRQFFLIATFIGLSFNAFADSELKQAFNQAYRNYQASEKDGDQDKVYQYAQESYQLGSKLFGEGHLNTANLGINWAIALTKAKETSQAITVMHEAISVLEDKLEDSSMELVVAYETLGDAIPRMDRKKKIKTYNKALKVARDIDNLDPLILADTQTDLGKKLLSLGAKESRIIVDANEVFAEHLKPSAKRLVYSNFYVGKYYLARGRNSKAIEYLSKNLPVFEALDGPTHHLELVSRAYLVQAHEKRGNSDEATEHCIAIGSMKPWDKDQEQTPLYRVNPMYPSSAARFGQEGWVQIAFNVTPTGFVNDLEILDSYGGVDFHKQALKALEQWRYAPKFEDGKAVTSRSRVQLDFKLGKK